VITTRIVLVTTTSARGIVESVAKELMNSYNDLELRVIVTSASVASLTSTEDIMDDLLKHRKLIADADLVILPGMIRGSAKKLEEVLNVPVVKGPKYAGDLPEMIALLKRGMHFSADISADDVISIDGRKRLDRLFKSMEKIECCFKVRNVSFVLKPPPLNLFYELCPASFSVCKLRRFRDFRTLVAGLAKLGYSGIIIGCDAEESCYDDLPLKLLEIRKHGLLAGIDVYDLSKVPRKIYEFTDIVLNVTAKDIDIIKRHAQKDMILVLVPERTDSLSEAMDSLMRAINLAENAGFRKLVIDPILKPAMLGLTQSLMLLKKS